VYRKRILLNVIIATRGLRLISSVVKCFTVSIAFLVFIRTRRHVLIAMERVDVSSVIRMDIVRLDGIWR